jgi:ribosomal protein L32
MDVGMGTRLGWGTVTMSWVIIIIAVSFALKGLNSRRLPYQPPSRSPVRQMCQNCGALHLSHARYCPRCGQPI